MKPQTLKKRMGCLRAVFDYLLLHGAATVNSFRAVPNIKAKETDYRSRGCYGLDVVTGAFNKPRDNGPHYLLCLAIYATGIRNGEIGRVKADDIIEMNGRYFIDIKESKSRNGVRLVPLHPFVQARIAEHIAEYNTKGAGYVFGNDRPLAEKDFTGAGNAMGAVPGFDTAFLEARNITFYSGRHYWKTLMSDERLGDIEEYFMGHKVSSDVAKRYNHRDKTGRERLLEKAGEVFSILDRRLFADKPPPG
jgi:integrase